MKDHPLADDAMERTTHISGTALAAQARYAACMLEFLDRHFDKMPIRNEYMAVAGGGVASTGAKSYTRT